MRVFQAFIWGMALVLNVSACAAPADPWEAFLSNPDASTSERLLAGLDAKRCNWGSPENEIQFPAAARERLFSAIESGSAEALRVGLRVRACLDGGDLGDFKRSVGRLVEASPLEFVRIVASERVEPEYAAQLAMMLPLEEDQKLLDEALANRLVALRKLKGLSDAQEEIRRRCVDALSQRREKLES